MPVSRRHTYDCVVTWTGNRGTGTSSYRGYDRAHDVTGDARATILGSADPAFHGDPARWNPEQLLVASLSQCHMLWYLHLAAKAGVVVTGYADRATGTMVEESDGSGQFAEVVLRPAVIVSQPAMVEPARQLHERAAVMCFIARSVNFPVRHEPSVVASAGDAGPDAHIL
jgi:organic hydroperoxide reductase OsmC/OhrA